MSDAYTIGGLRLSKQGEKKGLHLQMVGKISHSLIYRQCIQHYGIKRQDDFSPRRVS